MRSELRKDWYEFGELLDVTGLGTRACRELVRTFPGHLITEEPGPAGGRPRKLYHFTCHPQLVAWHERHRAQQAEENLPEAGNPVAADDLAVAELRLKCVLEARARRKTLSAQDARAATAADWSRRRPVETVHYDDRLDGGHHRKRTVSVSLGKVSPASLRRWETAYKANCKDTAGVEVPALAIPALAPKRKGNTGRARKTVDNDILQFIVALEAYSVRGDVPAAVAIARHKYPDRVPHFSLRTWQRRLEEYDPHDMHRDLSQGIGKFRAKQLPDVETDWNALGFNERFEIDDVRKDYYVIASDLERTLRPYAYAILRCSTRQWVSMVTSETPITKEQVRALIGFTLCSNSGGIPEVFKFEHGAVACDNDMREKLELAGVTVSTIEMDAGRKHPGAAPDRGRGNPRGHALVESNHKRLHRLGGYMPGQVGPEERHTAPANLEAARKLAVAKAKAGEIVDWPDVNRYHQLERMFCEISNNTPHTGLPQWCDSSGEIRHLTPNERAMQMKDTPVRVLPAECFPVFGMIGRVVPITKNGFRLNNMTYGRFDMRLKQFKEVTVYADPKLSRWVYVKELGEVVERYYKRTPGQKDNQFEQRARMEKRLRNQYEATTERMLEMLGEGEIIPIDRMHLTQNPTPERQVEVVMPDELRQVVNNFRRSVSVAEDREAKFERTFEVDSKGDSTTGSSGRGMLARSEKIAAHAAMYNHNPDEEEDW